MTVKNEYCAEVIANCETRPGSRIFEIQFRLESVFTEKARAGQFLTLEKLFSESIMRRPFSILRADKDLLSIMVEVVGPNTKAYSELTVGDTIKLFGPIGKPFPIIKAGLNSYILVGGGLGIVALFMLGKELVLNGDEVTVRLGAKNRSQMIGEQYFRQLGCEVKTIFEPWQVTDLLREQLEDGSKSIIIACGPGLMLKSVHDLAEEYGNECWVIVEETMACGTGSCKGCAIWGFDEQGKDAVKHICEDGPAFRSNWINWKRFIPKPAPAIITKAGKVENPMKTVLAGKNGRELVLDYPVMFASGCYGKEVLAQGEIDIARVGAIITKTVTLMPILGNPSPRICEVPGGMLNAIGLENIGLAKFLNEDLPIWIGFGKPVIINISGKSIREFVAVAKGIVHENIAGIVGIELNISCPNVESGMAFGVSAESTFQLVKAVRKVAPQMFLIVKLTPNVTDIAEIAKAAVKGEADALSIGNTLKAMAIDVWTRKPKIANITGGYSGQAIHPVALVKVWEVYQANLGVPIIGIGGASRAETVADFIIAGASAVGIGTGSFSNQNIFSEIDKGLREIMKHHNIFQISDLVGALAV